MKSNMLLKKKILLINAESKSEILEIERIAKRNNRKVDIGIRLNPNTDAKTLSKISTGKKENKFGVNEKVFLDLVNYSKNSQNLILLNSLIMKNGLMKIFCQKVLKLHLD